MENFVFGFSSFVFPLFFFGIIAIFVLIMVTIVSKSIRQNRFNRSQPKLSTVAKVISKRTHIIQRGHLSEGLEHLSNGTRYYITFEFETGNRVELEIPTDEYGLLLEQDSGKLTFQGNMFHQFDREKQSTAS